MSFKPEKFIKSLIFGKNTEQRGVCYTDSKNNILRRVGNGNQIPKNFVISLAESKAGVENSYILTTLILTKFPIMRFCLNFASNS